MRKKGTPKRGEWENIDLSICIFFPFMLLSRVVFFVFFAFYFAFLFFLLVAFFFQMLKRLE